MHNIKKVSDHKSLRFSSTFQWYEPNIFLFEKFDKNFSVKNNWKNFKCSFKFKNALNAHLNSY